jgi:transcriptional regulator with XRE-family HTH domain
MATDVKVAIVPGGITRGRPEWALVHYKDEPYALYLRALRQGLLARAVAAESSKIAELAEGIGISRSTLSRFLSGRSTSIDVTLAILKELRLKFEDVCRPLDSHLLERLIRDGAVIERGTVTLLTVDPMSLVTANGFGGLPPARDEG